MIEQRPFLIVRRGKARVQWTAAPPRLHDALVIDLTQGTLIGGKPHLRATAARLIEPHIALAEAAVREWGERLARQYLPTEG